ncbi:MAG TPA: UbiA family prenyltransferase [Steroidobacteraceae bacterium]|jgi:4-hydroxybenzoate polyprenyltransferase
MVAAPQTFASAVYVDLEGQLVRTDLMLESALRLIKQSAFNTFLVLWWALHGKSALASKLAQRVTLDPATLPYDGKLLAWLATERAAGRELWLRSGANAELTKAIAAHLQMFTGILSAAGPDGVHWRTSGGEVAAGPRASALSRAKALWPALRPHQWTKNVLVFVPALAAHRAIDVATDLRAMVAFVAMCLCASSVYILNDLLDLEADRAHPRKCRRPFASGSASIGAGLALLPCLLVAGAALAAWLPQKFQLALAAYYALTVGYSFGIKKFLVLDAIALAGLYTLRIIAGAGAAEVALSFWLLLFSVFLFLSLAFVKRYAELDTLRRQQRLQALGRGYRVEDLAVLQSFGCASGYMSVLVLALYINSPAIQSLYHQPKFIWTLCVALLYWISRVWMFAHRGSMHDDPVVFALRDKVSLGIGLLSAVAVALAV